MADAVKPTVTMVWLGPEGLFIRLVTTPDVTWGRVVSTTCTLV
jgi:hypothetical protein